MLVIIKITTTTWYLYAFCFSTKPHPTLRNNLTPTAGVCVTAYYIPSSSTTKPQVIPSYLRVHFGQVVTYMEELRPPNESLSLLSPMIRTELPLLYRLVLRSIGPAVC